MLSRCKWHTKLNSSENENLSEPTLPTWINAAVGTHGAENQCPGKMLPRLINPMSEERPPDFLLELFFGTGKMGACARRAPRWANKEEAMIALGLRGRGGLSRSNPCD